MVTSADDDENDNETQKRRWKHILTKREFWQYRNKSGNGWDRGGWNKELNYIAAWKGPAQGNTQAITRAKYILFQRTNKKLEDASGLSQMKGYHSFEVDLSHHIQEAFVIVSTGSHVSFFANPYVQEWLRNLDPAHRPIYSQKVLRILRVIQYILNKEISLILNVLDDSKDVQNFLTVYRPVGWIKVTKPFLNIWISKE